MKPNSAVFIEVFTEIEQKIKEICGSEDYLPFSEMLRIAKVRNNVIRQYAGDLKEYAQLRNAIVHTRRQDFVIAEPHESVVQELLHIKKLLNDPPRISSVMRRNPFFTTPNASIMEVLVAFSEKGFMRCPIISDGKIIGLVNSKSISRWLTANNKNRIDLTLSKVAEIVPFTDNDDYHIAAANADALSLVGLFKNSIRQGRYIQAVLVTRNGQPTSELVGIIAPSDLPMIVERIDRI